MIYGQNVCADDVLMQPAELPPRPRFQSVTVVETPFCTITVRRVEADLFAAVDADDLGSNADIRRAVKGLTSKRAIFQALADLPRVVEIQVTDRQTRDGAVMFPERRSWPAQS